MQADQRELVENQLDVGDRVYLTARCDGRRWRAGETGRVVCVSRWGRYHVRLDRVGGPPLGSFAPDEVERIGTRAG
jgi:hypothetical protein